MFQQKKATKNDDNSEIEVDSASPKDVPKKNTYLQKKDTKLLMN